MKNTILTKETAMVWRGANRRYFSKESAARSLAWQEWSEKNPCECDFSNCVCGQSDEVRKLIRFRTHEIIASESKGGKV